MFSNFAALDLAAMPSTRRRDAPIHAVPPVRATVETPRGYARAGTDFAPPPLAGPPPPARGRGGPPRGFGRLPLRRLVRHPHRPRGLAPADVPGRRARPLRRQAGPRACLHRGRFRQRVRLLSRSAAAPQIIARDYTIC